MKDTKKKIKENTQLLVDLNTIKFRDKKLKTAIKKKKDELDSLG